MNVSTEVAALISRIVQLSSPSLLLPLCDELEQLPANADLEHIVSLFRHVQRGDIRACLLEIVTAVKSSGLQVSAVSLSLALRSAIHCSEFTNEGTNLELVWSGPSKPLSSIRRTDQVLADMIVEARQSILVVSFAVYKVPGIMNGLRAAMDKGVAVKIIIETEKDSHGRLKTDGLSEVLDSGIRVTDIYVWPESRRPGNDRGHTGVLHAKCAVADSRVALISSANLTEAAMDLNMEMGIVVRGSEIPSMIEDHFRSLISLQVISQVLL